MKFLIFFQWHLLILNELFQNEINFSHGLFINPNRKNGLWKYKITKKAILQKAISSYQN